jgi:hypothetical protein
LGKGDPTNRQKTPQRQARRLRGRSQPPQAKQKNRLVSTGLGISQKTWFRSLGWGEQAGIFEDVNQRIIADRAVMLKADKLTEIVAKLIAILQQE